MTTRTMFDEARLQVPLAPEEWPQEPIAQNTEARLRIDTAIRDPRVVALLRFVVTRPNERAPWQPFFGRIDLCRPGDFETGPRLHYKNVRTLSQEVPAISFARMVDAVVLGEESLVCDGVPLAPFGPAPRWEVQRHASVSGYTAWPCLYLARGHQHAAYRNIFGALASADDSTPYCKDIWALVGRIAGFRVFHGASDARAPLINVFLWNYSAKFAETAIISSRKLALALQGDDLSRMVLRGRFVGAVSVQEIGEAAEAKSTLIATIQPTRVELALVDREHTIVDKTEFLWTPPSASAAVETAESIALRCLEMGECQRIEFKPFVRLDGSDSKWNEVFATARAMANVGDGTILVGVDDRGRPKFGPDEYRIVAASEAAQLLSMPPEQRRSLLEEAILAYGSALRDRMEQHINRSLYIANRVAWVNDSPILMMFVPQGSEPPYADRRDNSILYRAGATNRLASEAELVALFARRRR